MGTQKCRMTFGRWTERGGKTLLWAGRRVSGVKTELILLKRGLSCVWESCHGAIRVR